MTDVEAQAIKVAALAHLHAVDPVLRRLIDAVGPFALQRDPGNFYALFSSIVSQQISVRAAAMAEPWAFRFYARRESATMAYAAVQLCSTYPAKIGSMHTLHMLAHIGDAGTD